MTELLRPQTTQLETLERIELLQLPEDISSAESEEFFYNQQFGQLFAKVVEEHGSPSHAIPRAIQLRGSDGHERFLATYFPKREHQGEIIPGSFHAYITKNVSFNKPNYTIPITIPLDTGVPIVSINERGKTGVIIGDRLEPSRALTEVQRLASLMRAAYMAIEPIDDPFEVGANPLE